jgi:hypothetical protein
MIGRAMLSTSKTIIDSRWNVLPAIVLTLITQSGEILFTPLSSQQSLQTCMLGIRCFVDCPKIETIVFEELSILNNIGGRALLRCMLHSITIPALIKEIDVSALLDCPLVSIDPRFTTKPQFQS